MAYLTVERVIHRNGDEGFNAFVTTGELTPTHLEVLNKGDFVVKFNSRREALDWEYRLRELVGWYLTTTFVYEF